MIARGSWPSVSSNRVAAAAGCRREVGGQLRVVEDAVFERVAHPAELVEQHGGVGGAQGGVAGSGARDQRVDVRRQ